MINANAWLGGRSPSNYANEREKESRARKPSFVFAKLQKACSLFGYFKISAGFSASESIQEKIRIKMLPTRT
jgi:hypothetical protein